MEGHLKFIRTQQCRKILSKPQNIKFFKEINDAKALALKSRIKVVTEVNLNDVRQNLAP